MCIIIIIIYTLVMILYVRTQLQRVRTLLQVAPNCIKFVNSEEYFESFAVSPFPLIFR